MSDISFMVSSQRTVPRKFWMQCVLVFSQSPANVSAKGAMGGHNCKKQPGGLPSPKTFKLIQNSGNTIQYPRKIKTCKCPRNRYESGVKYRAPCVFQH